MKTSKRIIAAVLMVMILASVMVFPASATVSATLRSKITKFPYLYSGVSDRTSVKALQKFLLNDPDNTYRADLLKYGMDGGYGTTTQRAVRDFQIRHEIYGPNGNGTGEVYTQTWGKIADELTQSGSILRTCGTDIYEYILISSGSSTLYKFFYFDEYGEPKVFTTVS